MARRKCDTDLANKLRYALLATLPPSAKDAWESAQGKPKDVEGNDGWRCFLQYRAPVDCSHWRCPVDWESLQAAIGVFRAVAPIVCDMYL